MTKGRYVSSHWLDEHLSSEELRRIVVEEWERATFGRLGLPSSDLHGAIHTALTTPEPTPVRVQWRDDALQQVGEAVQKSLVRAHEQLTREMFGLSPESLATEAAPAPSLTLADTLKTLRALRPILYYATHDAMPLGRVLHAPERPGWPEVIFCHPDDLPGLRARLPWLSLRPFREWSPRPEDIEAAFQEAIAAFSKDGG